MHVYTHIQGYRQSCGIGVAFGGCGSINAWIMSVHVGNEVCTHKNWPF